MPAGHMSTVQRRQLSSLGVGGQRMMAPFDTQTTNPALHTQYIAIRGRSAAAASAVVVVPCHKPFLPGTSVVEPAAIDSDCSAFRIKCDVSSVDEF